MVGNGVFYPFILLCVWGYFDKSIIYDSLFCIYAPHEEVFVNGRPLRTKGWGLLKLCICNNEITYPLVCFLEHRWEYGLNFAVLHDVE